MWANPKTEAPCHEEVLRETNAITGRERAEKTSVLKQTLLLTRSHNSPVPQKTCLHADCVWRLSLISFNVISHLKTVFTVKNRHESRLFHVLTVNVTVQNIHLKKIRLCLLVDFLLSVLIQQIMICLCNKFNL